MSVVNADELYVARRCCVDLYLTPFIEEHVGMGTPDFVSVTTPRGYPIIAVVPLCVAGAYESGVVARVG